MNKLSKTISKDLNKTWTFGLRTFGIDLVLTYRPVHWCLGAELFFSCPPTLDNYRAAGGDFRLGPLTLSILFDTWREDYLDE